MVAGTRSRPGELSSEMHRLPVSSENAFQGTHSAMGMARKTVESNPHRPCRSHLGENHSGDSRCPFQVD